MAGETSEYGPVLTTAQVGEWLQLRPRQVQRLGIPYLDCGTRSRRYLKSDVVAWLEAHRIAAEIVPLWPERCCMEGADASL